MRIDVRSRRQPLGPVPHGQQGQSLVVTALFMVLLVALAGLAIDVGHQMDRYREAQNTADAAALAGAYAVYTSSGNPVTMTTQLANNAAAEVVQANGLGSQQLHLSFLNQSEQVITSTSSLTNSAQIAYVAAHVQDTFTPYFIQVLGITHSSVSTYAMAQVMGKSQCEFCVLNSSASKALNFSGQGTFNGTNVQITVNSTAGDALDVSGQGTIVITGTGAVNVVGNYSAGNNSTISPQPSTGVAPALDPLAWLPTPVDIPLGSCVSDKNNSCNGTPPSVLITSSITQTIYPGIYSSITVNQGTLVLEPGIYVITGSFSAESQASIVGNGVMLYLTCSTIPYSKPPSPYYEQCPAGGLAKKQSEGSLNLAGGAMVTLSAPTASQAAMCTVNPPTVPACPSTGAYQAEPAYVPWQYTGLLIFQDRNDNASMSLAGQSNVSPPALCTTATSGASCIAGTIYAKDAQVTIVGGGSYQTPVQSYVIADTANVGGNGGGGSQSLAMSFPSGSTNATLAPPGMLVQ
jgi:Flp pilus assembly protein TadG